MDIHGNPYLKMLSLLLVLLLSIPCSALAETAKSSSPQTSISFKEPTYVVPGKRISLNAEVTDSAGIKLVRCYFRATGEADYLFVPMTQNGPSGYTAILPALSASSTALEYVVLAVNTLGIVVKSKPVLVPVDTTKTAPSYQNIAAAGVILASTELVQAPSTVVWI